MPHEQQYCKKNFQREMLLLLPYVENILNAACESDVTVNVTATSITSSIHA
jgi:hypothetical protein